MSNPLNWAFEKLKTLREEHSALELQAWELRQQQAKIHDRILQLGGAIQTLEEMIEQAGPFREATEAISSDS